MNAFVSIFLAVLSIILFFLENYTSGMVFAIPSFILFIQSVKTQFGMNSIFFLFLVFFGLYGYAVPISILFSLDIGWHKVARFYLWDKIDVTLLSYMISNQIALIGLVLAKEVFAKLKVHATVKRGEVFDFYRLSILTAALTSLSELLNFIRVGGMSAIGMGKAYYQSSINDLVLNIPTEGYFYVALSFFSLSIVHKQIELRDFKRIGLFILIIFFFLFVNVSIGERGILIFGIAVLFLAFTSQLKIVKLRFWMILGLGVLYLAFNILTILREPEKEFTSIESFYHENGNLLGRLMNPSNTEFGAAAYNYRLFTSEDFQYKYGTTYLETILSPIPTYVYPNKPKSISYVYRDKFNADRKKQGSIAGTGFSSLLEAYINLWYFGPFIIYFFLGIAIVVLENYRNTNRIFIDVFYLISFSLFMIFSRSASSYIFLKLVFYIFQILSPIILYQIMFGNVKDE